MSFFPVYIVGRLFFQIGNFFRHWYVDSFYFMLRKAADLFHDLDRTIAFRVTLYHFFEPLYGDYSVAGRILGPIFRVLRVMLGALAYLILGMLAVLIYLVWLLIPPVLIALIFLQK